MPKANKWGEGIRAARRRNETFSLLTRLVDLHDHASPPYRPMKTPRKYFPLPPALPDRPPAAPRPGEPAAAIVGCGRCGSPVDVVGGRCQDCRIAEAIRG